MASTATTTGSPCGACKFLRRKCARGCVFAPYFCHEQGAAHFAAIHKVFGASNAAKLLAHLPAAERCEAVVTITFEAQSRLRDPVYGCVAQIFALQQQVAILQAQLMQAKAQLACGIQSTSPAASLISQQHHHHHQWPDSASSISALLRQQEGSGFGGAATLPELMGGDGVTPMSSMQQHCSKVDGGELQYLAQAMMRSPNYSGF